MVRIKDFRQTWIIIPAGKEMTHVVLEGFIDPAGSVPDWVSNMLIIDTPFKSISGLKNEWRNNRPTYLFRTREMNLSKFDKLEIFQISYINAGRF